MEFPLWPIFFLHSTPISVQYWKVQKLGNVSWTQKFFDHQLRKGHLSRIFLHVFQTTKGFEVEIKKLSFLVTWWSSTHYIKSLIFVQKLHLTKPSFNFCKIRPTLIFAKNAHIGILLSKLGHNLDFWNSVHHKRKRKNRLHQRRNKVEKKRYRLV